MVLFTGNNFRKICKRELFSWLQFYIKVQPRINSWSATSLTWMALCDVWAVTYLSKNKWINIGWVKVHLLSLYSLLPLDHAVISSMLLLLETFKCIQSNDTKIKMSLLCLFQWALKPPGPADKHIKEHVSIPDLSPKAWL